MEENKWYQTDDYLYTIFSNNVYVIYHMQGENPFITVYTEEAEYKKYLEKLSISAWGIHRDIVDSIRSWPNWRVNLIKTLFKTSTSMHFYDVKFSMYNISKYSNWGNN